MADLDKVLTGVGSIASPVAAIGGSVINGIFQSRQNRINRVWTEQQNDLAWQRQNQLINEQRSYDTPKAQMQRLMEAGLNPNLIYGDLGGNMQAQSVPNAAGSYQGVAPQVDPLALSQSLLNMANARKAQQDTKMSKAQTDKILKLTDKEYELLQSNINRINQTIMSDSYTAALAELKTQFLKSDSPIDFSVTDKDGNTVVSRWIVNAAEAFKSLWSQQLKSDLSTTDAQFAVQKLLAELSGAQGYANKIHLENQQLAEFVRVAADIANGQASEARLLSTISDMDNNFYSQLGAGEGAVSTITRFLMAIIGMLKR